MPPFKRLFAQTIISMALFSTSYTAFAQTEAHSENNTEATIHNEPRVVLKKPIVKKGSELSAQEQEDAAEVMRLQVVSQRADNVFGLLMSEMAYEQGDTLPAMLSYQVLLARSQSPDIAERAVDIALENKAFDLANQALEEWAKFEPIPSASQKQMLWERDVRVGKTDNIFPPLGSLLENATEFQVRRMFLQVAQLSLENPDVVHLGNKTVHQQALKYPDLPEAAIADVLYSSADGNRRNGINALKRLAAADTDIRPATQLALTLLAQKQPDVLVDFFKSTPSDKLSNMWQIVEIEVYLKRKDNEKAYELITKSLANNPNADLLIQAGFLAKQRKEPQALVDGFYERAYGLGNADQKSRAAIMMSVFAFRDNNAQKGGFWAERITSPRFAFDKNMLLASAAVDKGNWKDLRTHLQAASKLDPSTGSIFGVVDYLQLTFVDLATRENAKDTLAGFNALIDKMAKDPKTDSDLLAQAYYQRALYKSDVMDLHDSAVVDMRQYLQMKPGDPEGMNALGYTLLDERDTVDEGFQLIEQAHAKLPDAPHVLDSLGWAYYKTNNLVKARYYLEQAYAAMPNDDVAAHLGEVYWQMGQHRQAIDVWQKGLAQTEVSPFSSKRAKKTLLEKTMHRFGVVPEKTTVPTEVEVQVPQDNKTQR